MSEKTISSPIAMSIAMVSAVIGFGANEVTDYFKAKRAESSEILKQELVDVRTIYAEYTKIQPTITELNAQILSVKKRKQSFVSEDARNLLSALMVDLGEQAAEMTLVAQLDREVTQQKRVEKEATSRGKNEKGAMAAAGMVAKDAAANRRKAEQQAAAARARILERSQRLSEAVTVDDTINKLQRHVTAHMNLPPNLERDAHVTYAVTVDSDGRVQAMKLIKTSQNGAYEAAARRAIQNASPLPLPPRYVRKGFTETLIFNFMPSS